MQADKSRYRRNGARWLKATLFAVVVTLLGCALHWKIGGAGKNEVVLFVLAVLAIGFALYQFTDSDELKEALRSVKLVNIQETPACRQSE